MLEGNERAVYKDSNPSVSAGHTFSSLFSCMLFLISIQDIAILFNLIIILLMLFNTFVFQVGLVAILLERFRALLMLSALYLTFSIILHSWLMVRLYAH